ncbi:interleukin-17A-like [Anomaloglossus baeobatrachus]|uniref:interleukin-17A-like n=1 Tax=Anomaloglossus baeobatrachus TaxID=238106 RepID=UPI003F508B7D
MDVLTAPRKVTALLLLIGVSTLMSVQCVNPNHLHRGCPPIKLPATVRIHTNVTGLSGQDSLLLSGDVNKRSTSPWEYSYEKNNGYPIIIAEAKCEMAGCTDANGNALNNLNSVPIRQEILVLHREMQGCHSVFKLVKKMVTVGCTCVRPLIQEQL